MEFTLWSVLLTFGMLQGFLLAGILLAKKSEYPAATHYLAFLAFLLALLSSGHVVALSELRSVIPVYPHLIGPFWFLLGPVFYGYVRLLSKKPLALSWKQTLHLLPFALKYLPVLHALLFWESYSQAVYRQYLFQPNDGSFAFWPLVYTHSLMVHLFVYALLSMRLLRSVEYSYKQEASHPQVEHTVWLRLAFGGFMLYIIYETVLSSVLIVNRTLSPVYIHFSVFLLTSLLYGVVYIAIAHPHILFPPAVTAPDKYARSVLPDAYRAQHKEKIERLMHEEKPYLRGDLKLRDLADMLDMSTHHLTQVLNQELNQSFYDFVNSYRIQEAQTRLQDPAYRDFSILAIALEVGFNSKSTFNRLFKKYTHMTPTQYMKTCPVPSQKSSNRLHPYG